MALRGIMSPADKKHIQPNKFTQAFSDKYSEIERRKLDVDTMYALLGQISDVAEHAMLGIRLGGTTAGSKLLGFGLSQASIAETVALAREIQKLYKRMEEGK